MPVDKNFSLWVLEMRRRMSTTQKNAPYFFPFRIDCTVTCNGSTFFLRKMMRSMWDGNRIKCPTTVAALSSVAFTLFWQSLRLSLLWDKTKYSQVVVGEGGPPQDPP